MQIYFDGKIFVYLSLGEPHKVKVVIDNFQDQQNVNAITGKDSKQNCGQDYLGFEIISLISVCPPEYWLSGVPKEGKDENIQLLVPSLGVGAPKPPILHIEITPKVRIIFFTDKQLKKEFVILKKLKNEKEETKDENSTTEWTINPSLKCEYEKLFEEASQGQSYLDGK